MDGFCGIIGWYELVLDGRDEIYGVIGRFCGGISGDLSSIN